MGKRKKRPNRRRSNHHPPGGFTSSKYLLLLVVLVILAIGALLVFQPSLVRSLRSVAFANSAGASISSTVTPVLSTATPTVAQTKPAPVRVEPNWKDYSSTAFGFALQFPPYMIWRAGTPAKDILLSVSFYPEKDSNIPAYQVSEITVSIYSNPQAFGTADWIKAHETPSDASAILFEGVTDLQSIQVGGQSAFGFEEKPAGIAAAHRIVLARGSQVFSILVTDLGDGALREIYNAMVSTVHWSPSR
jgi:hypothetical protein